MDQTIFNVKEQDDEIRYLWGIFWGLFAGIRGGSSELRSACVFTVIMCWTVGVAWIYAMPYTYNLWHYLIYTSCGTV